MEPSRFEWVPADYMTALDLNPQYAPAYYNRGNVYHAQGDHTRAIADFTTAIDLNPEYAEAYNNRATAYAAQGDHTGAIADFTAAIDLNPKYTAAYNNRGAIYAIQRDHARAIADFTTALDLDPKDAEAYKNRATAYAAQGDYTQAIADFTAAIDLNSYLHYKTYIKKASSCEKMGDIAGAVEAYRGFIQYAPPQKVGEINLVKQKIRALEQHEHVNIPSQPSGQ